MTDPDKMTAVLSFIRTYVNEHQTGPLITEIAKACDINISQASRCVHILHEQNRIRKTWRQRSIAPIDVPEEVLILSPYRLRERILAQSPGKLRFD